METPINPICVICEVSLGPLAPQASRPDFLGHRLCWDCHQEMLEYARHLRHLHEQTRRERAAQERIRALGGHPMLTVYGGEPQPLPPQRVRAAMEGTPLGHTIWHGL